LDAKGFALPNKFTIVGGSDAVSGGITIDIEELARLQDEAAVLHDCAASLAKERDGLLAEREAPQKRTPAPKAKKQATRKPAPPRRRASPMTVQYGALPYRFNEARALEVLLITTKQSKRWIIPKGRPIGGLKPAKCAAREAFEEAGVRGAVGKKPIGAFRFVKTVDDSLSLLCRVRVYPMKVKRQMRSWPEALHRTQRWFEPAAALAAVNDVGLKTVIGRFVETMTASPPALN
jgi:8-oxo-dGTP pyrophosphatase MutT (NUDIX family)